MPTAPPTATSERLSSPAALPMQRGMRGTRAYLGALGAGMSMAVAASLVLLVVSSVVAFRGWPDDIQSSADPATSALVAAPVTSRRSLRVGAARFAALALPRVRRGATRGASTRRAARRRSRAGLTRPTGSPAATTPGPSPATDATGAGTPSTTSGVGSRVSGATDQVAGAVGDTTQAAAGAVAPVSPAAAGALTQIGAAGSTVVSGAGHAVGKAVDGLLPPPR